MDLEKLAEFIVNANQNTYAAGGKEVKTSIEGFKELRFKKGDYEYIDLYTGFYTFPGISIIKYKNKPVWTMSYVGGMKPEEHKRAKETYSFLKEALMRVTEEYPFRGPELFKKKTFKYSCKVRGNLEYFTGKEIIKQDNKEIYRVDFIGGLVFSK